MSERDIERRTVLRTAGAGLVAALGAGTATGAGTTTGAETETPGGDGDDRTTVPVRAGHLVPDGEPVDVYVDGRQVFSELEYGSVTEYIHVPAGEHTVTLIAAGNTDEAGEVVGEDTDTLSPDGGSRTVVAVGQEVEETIEMRTYMDARSNHDPSTAQVRVVHASPDAPPVTVSAGGTTLAEDLSLGEVSEYATVPAGDYSVSVAPAAGDDPVASFEASLDGCSVYTAFATGYLDPANAPEGVDSPFDAVTTLNDSGIAPDFEATLSGATEVSSVDTDAESRAVFDRRDDRMRFEVAATGLENVTAGHIHAGGSGENGPVVVPLFSFASGVDGPESEARTVEGTLANASFTAEDFTGPLAGGTMEDLVAQIRSGEAYVNVHTVDNPSGEVRGKLTRRAPRSAGDSG